MSAAAMTFDDAFFDFVHGAYIIHHLEPASFGAEVARVLKPRGLFAIVNWHRRPREETTVLGEPRGPKTELRMTPTQTKAAVESAGLAFIHKVEIEPFHYAAIFQKRENKSVV